MRVSAATPGRQYIQRYGGGGFRVSGVAWPGSIIVFAVRTIAWPVAAFADASEADFAPIFAETPAPEVLLIGTGPKLEPLPATLRARFRAAQIGVDTMDTGAACRTFSLLVGEGRRVAAALVALA